MKQSRGRKLFNVWRSQYLSSWSANAYSLRGKGNLPENQWINMSTPAFILFNRDRRSNRPNHQFGDFARIVMKFSAIRQMHRKFGFREPLEFEGGSIHINFLSNVQGEPRRQVARSPALAGGVTLAGVGSTALLGSFGFSSS